VEKNPLSFVLYCSWEPADDSIDIVLCTKIGQSSDITQYYQAKKKTDEWDPGTGIQIYIFYRFRDHFMTRSLKFGTISGDSKINKKRMNTLVSINIIKNNLKKQERQFFLFSC
jgi:hypothetical protein